VPEAAGFDWESLLGVKGAAWVGGIAFAIAGILFAKFAIDRNLITPELRIALLTLVGSGSLVAAELSLRRGYATTANSVSGAGIAILYATFFAAHSLYGLLPLGLTFALMALVTVLAGVLAVRYDAFFTALLGLLGGFATPVALSTGVDRPIGLFSYILLLNVGLVAVALRKRWHGLTLLALAGTFVIEIGWFSQHMAPHKMLVGLLAFLVFGILYLVLPLIARSEEGAEDSNLLRIGTVGGVAPFLFAMLIAGDKAYATEWPLLFGFVALLDAALVTVAVLRERHLLAVSAALATGLVLPLWAGSGLRPSEALAPTIAATLIVLLLNLGPRLAAWLDRPGGVLVDAAGAIAGAGLGLFGLVLLGRGAGEPSAAFFVVLAGLLLVQAERTASLPLSRLAPLGGAAVALLVQVWVLSATTEATLVRNLAVPLVVTIALQVLAGLRRAEAEGASGEEAGSAWSEAAAVAANLVGLAGLYVCIGTSRFAADPLPLLLAVVVSTGLLMLSALAQKWAPLVPLALGLSAGHLTLWTFARFEPADLGVVLLFALAGVAAFLALPFLPGPFERRFGRSPWALGAAALAGPAFFLALRHALERGAPGLPIGALPLGLAAMLLPALRGVVLRFPRQRDAQADRPRLRYVALFAAVALGLVAVAIPLQLDRQWLTLGWALEAAAVWWLFGRVPHPGLRLFGALLFAAVGARLLLNPEVLRYHERAMPVLNWILYTYGVAALAALLGGAALRRAETSADARAAGILPGRLADAAGLLGLLLVFALINLEIADYFSPGRYLELTGERGYARDLTTSLAWGLYAMSLLVIGVWRRIPALRQVSLGFLLLTVAKVFLFDLSNLGGLYRVLSFLGLGLGLILVSLFYQRFVFRKEPAE